MPLLRSKFDAHVLVVHKGFEVVCVIRLLENFIHGIFKTFNIHHHAAVGAKYFQVRFPDDSEFNKHGRDAFPFFAPGSLKFLRARKLFIDFEIGFKLVYWKVAGITFRYSLFRWFLSRSSSAHHRRLSSRRMLHQHAGVGKLPTVRAWSP